MREERLLTYAELAAELGISLKAAKERVRRARWPRVVGNDGIAKVRVPAEAVVPTRSATGSTTQGPHEASTVVPSEDAVATAGPVVGELLAQLAELTEANARLRVELARAQEREAASETLAEERVRAAQAVAIADAATAKAEVKGKEGVITELRAELARLRRPWWRRLLD